VPSPSSLPLLCSAILLRSRINPALLILGGALIGLFAFGAR
jgi:hypothetical protein